MMTTISQKTSILYIVATPIGNLGDITQRALDVLNSVDYIAAEDTRHSQKLLNHVGIQKKLLSHHQHNESASSEKLIDLLRQGASIALISDAGTPLVADPGFTLVQKARAAGIQVVPIPGACALISALSASGMPADTFLFAGFLPAKPKHRTERLQALSQADHTIVCYESPHRIIACIQSILDTFGSTRTLCIAREISKTFETFFYGTVAQAQAWLQADPNQQRGEFVVILAGKPADKVNIDELAIRETLKILTQEVSLKTAAKITAKLHGISKNQAYDIGIKEVPGTY